MLALLFLIGSFVAALHFNHFEAWFNFATILGVIVYSFYHEFRRNKDE